MKSIVIFLGVVQLVFGQRGLPGLIQNPGACSFNGPQDAPTLSGVNFIENYGTNKCLSLQQYSANRNPTVLQQCTWQRYPTSEQLFIFRNGNGGTVVRPTRGPVRESCLAPTFGQRLSAVQCLPKNSDQTWRFIRIRPSIYQVQQMSSGNCLRPQSSMIGAEITLVRCNFLDSMQLWRICTSK